MVAVRKSEWYAKVINVLLYVWIWIMITKIHDITVMVYHETCVCIKWSVPWTRQWQCWTPSYQTSMPHCKLLRCIIYYSVEMAEEANIVMMVIVCRKIKDCFYATKTQFEQLDL
jgi:hypothetical protein